VNSRILVTCFSVPGRGGASTSAYRLFERMQDDGYNVHYLNLIDERMQRYYRQTFGFWAGNPAARRNVYRCIVRRPLNGPQPNVTKTIARLSPQLIVSVSHMGTALALGATRDVPLVFLASGSAQAKCYLAEGRAENVQDLISQLQRRVAPPEILHRRERESVAGSQRIVVHSEQTRFLYETFFPQHAHKIHPRTCWRADWIYAHARAFAARARAFPERPVDVMFVASDWKRLEKNFAMVKGIAEALPGRVLHVAGHNAPALPGVQRHGFVTDQERLYRMLGQTKTLVCPSILDAAPTVLFEASAMGCNVVASRNCGNWALCHPNLLVEPYAVEGFVRASARAMTRRFPDRIERFLMADGYHELLRVFSEIPVLEGA